MQKQIRQVSEDGSRVQITIADERWYIETKYDDAGKVVSMVEYPSSTWIAGFYPKGIGYLMWLAEQGYENAEKMMNDGGIRGSKVHSAITSLLLGNKLEMNDKFMNPKTNELEELTLEEWECLMSFAEWYEEFKPTMLANEITVFNHEHRYAGTVDFVCIINGEIWLIDFKTSKDVYPSHEIQISSYKHALPLEMQPQKMGILQLGYKKNKYKKWKMTEIPDQFDLFLAAKRIWAKETEGTVIFKKDYPTSLILSPQ